MGSTTVVNFPGIAAFIVSARLRTRWTLIGQQRSRLSYIQVLIVPYYTAIQVILCSKSTDKPVRNGTMHNCCQLGVFSTALSAQLHLAPHVALHNIAFSLNRHYHAIDNIS